MIDYLHEQESRRAEFLERIIVSRNPRKLIIAGPGTGKTYTFNQLFRSLPQGPKIALTFIRKLVRDMDQEFNGIAESSTFHKYCKRLLHERFGSVELAPYLPKIIMEDAKSIKRVYLSFESSFQTLREGSPEINYYLGRGRYYRAVSFDDSVYLVYRAVIDGTLELPRYSQIVIDEFQDFNPLEVAFINQLQERGNILIVGDDDQAIYLLRNSSPEHLRSKFRSTEYETFSLPYCSRCPRVIVEATSEFIIQVCSRVTIP
jgi:superfamily I DNA/RNA helicase